jgi:uncharacterized protein (DUF3820 family)
MTEVSSEISQISTPATSPTNKQKIINAYGSISLNFGKYKGNTLNSLLNKKPDYLLWLLGSMEQDSKPKTPTMKAIMSFIRYHLEDN